MNGLRLTLRIFNGVFSTLIVHMRAFKVDTTKELNLVREFSETINFGIGRFQCEKIANTFTDIR